MRTGYGQQKPTLNMDSATRSMRDLRACDLLGLYFYNKYSKKKDLISSQQLARLEKLSNDMTISHGGPQGLHPSPTCPLGPGPEARGSELNIPRPNIQLPEYSGIFNENSRFKMGHFVNIH